jgi:hypothetical protein
VSSPRAGLVGSPGEEVPGPLQNVSSRPWCIHCGFPDLFCLLALLLSSRRYADTSVLSLAPLKCLAQIARAVPSEPRPQPPCAEPLSGQAKERLAVATAMEESAVPPPLLTAAAVEEERTAMETTAPQVALEPPAEACSGGTDVVMVASYEDSAPPPLVGDRDVAMSSALEPSLVAGVPEPSPVAGAP